MIEYTKYTYGDSDSKQYLSLSNSWSRKSVDTVLDADKPGVLWTLMNKSKFSLVDEFGNLVDQNSFTEDEEFNIDLINSFDMGLVNWIKETIIKHIDFLVQTYRKKIEEK